MTDSPFKKTILITGAAGFIGYHLTKRLLQDKSFRVYGIDNLNDYYDTELKKDRLRLLKLSNKFHFDKIDLCDKKKLEKHIQKIEPSQIIHLAAQAGVRYSFQNPQSYIDSNVTGFLNLLEIVKDIQVEHLIYASSSSVYGDTKLAPFHESQVTDSPASLYAMTKKTGELMAGCYSRNFKIPTTGLRFFTVYGSLGRPDMAYFLFTKNILEGKEIKVFAKGKAQRDFTYVDDITAGIQAILKQGFCQKESLHNLYNIGNSKPVDLEDFISTLEELIGKKAQKMYIEKQLGDVDQTFSDTSSLQKDYGYSPDTDLVDGLKVFVDWYKEYYRVK